jgi:hypothetical protein
MSKTMPDLRIAAALALALVSGCSVNRDLRLDRSGPGLAPGTAVAIAPAPEGNPEAARFASALAEALAAEGHLISDDAAVTAVFGFAHRDRGIGAADGGTGAGAQGGAVKWISAPGRKRLLQSCKGERLRATIAFYGTAEMALIARATGEVDGCSFAGNDIDALARALVTQASARR